MASSNNYLQFILGQLSDLDDITYRVMMGEFIIYYRGKIVILSLLEYRQDEANGEINNGIK